MNGSAKMASRIMPWQFGALNLTEFGGNRIIKYTDALIDGVSRSSSSSLAAFCAHVHIHRLLPMTVAIHTPFECRRIVNSSTRFGHLSEPDDGMGHLHVSMSCHCTFQNIDR